MKSMVKRGKLSKVVFLAGIDGAGKTMCAKMLFEELRRQGVNAGYAWSRNNNYFSKPLLAFTLLSGLNYKERRGGFTFQYYEFWRWKLIAGLYIWLQAIDINIATYFKICRKSKKRDILICDRGPYDTLVDVMLGTGEDILAGGRYRAFIRMLPKEHKVIYLRRPVGKIVEDRPELRYDRGLLRKNELYAKMQRRFGWATVDNADSPEDTLKKIIGQLR